MSGNATITWKNVAAPNFAASNMLFNESSDRIAEAFTSGADILKGMHEDKSKRLTGEAEGLIANLTDRQTMAADVANITGQFDSRYLDNSAIAAANIAQRDSLLSTENTEQMMDSRSLDMDAQRFENSVMGESHALDIEKARAAIGASNRSGRSGTPGGTDDDYTAIRMEMQQPEFLNTDGSINRKKYLDYHATTGRDSRVPSNIFTNMDSGFAQTVEGKKAARKAKLADKTFETRLKHELDKTKEAFADPEDLLGNRVQSSSWNPIETDSMAKERLNNMMQRDRIKYSKKELAKIYAPGKYDDGVPKWSEYAANRAYIDSLKESVGN